MARKPKGRHRAYKEWIYNKILKELYMHFSI